MSTGRFRRDTVRVLIADDDEFIRRTLHRALEAEPNFKVVALAASADEAIIAAGESRPDVALLDVNMPGGGGAAAARAIRGSSPGTAIVALSAIEHATAVRTMLDAGAHSYVVKGTPLRELTSLLVSVIQDGGADTSELRAALQEPGEAERRVTVLIAEDDPRLLVTLSQVVESTTALELVGLAQTPHHAVSLAARHTPDVALVDVRMPGGGGARIAAEIRSCSPGTRIVAFSGHSDRESVMSMLRSGATSYVLKDSPVRDLVDAIVGAHRGSSRLADEVSSVVLRELMDRLDSPMSDSEFEIHRRERIEAVLAERALRMVFQPIETLTRSGAVGYEALARFEAAPERTPDVWFAEAASVGLGVDLELLAIRCALARLDSVPSDAFLTLNISPEAAVSRALRPLLSGAEERIVLEITEHAPVADYDELSAGLGDLRSAGVRLAVDDCGAGFASLRHVLLLNPDFIKLDIALCRDVSDPMRLAMARALVSFAKETGTEVIAEGIETREDLEVLRSLGVDYGQGYLLAPPGDLAAM